MTSIGERIIKLRKTLGLTQTEFAQELGITQQFVSQIEKGVREASEQLLKHLCDRYNTTMLWLVKGEGEMFLSPEEIIKKQIDQIGEKAYFKALHNIIDKSDPAIWGPVVETTRSPDLDHMISFLVKLWEIGDEEIKSWARVQFALAFPSDIEEIVIEKKRTQASALPTLIQHFIIKNDFEDR